jgi:hypothetical protein
LSALTGLMVGMHALIASGTKTPEMNLSEPEAKEFAKAASNYLRHYNVQATQKTVDMIALMSVSVAIYGPRIYAIRERQKEERVERGAIIKFPDRGKTARAAARSAPMPTAEMTEGGPQTVDFGTIDYTGVHTFGTGPEDGDGF